MIDNENWKTDVLEAVPSGGGAFLDALRRELNPEYICSIMFFGSVVKGDVSETSDIDFIIVLSENAPEQYRTELRHTLRCLAQTHLETETTAGNPLERVIQRTTGMFQSGFVATSADIRAGRFHRIFNTSRLVYYLAPWRTVLAGVFDEAVSVYQEPVFPNWNYIDDPLDYSEVEIVRSLLMTVTIATFQLLHSSVNNRGAIYSQEAYKWTVYNLSSHVLGRPSESLEEALATVPDIRGFHNLFHQIRTNACISIRTQLSFIPIIIALHVWGFGLSCGQVRPH